MACVVIIGLVASLGIGAVLSIPAFNPDAPVGRVKTPDSFTASGNQQEHEPPSDEPVQPDEPGDEAAAADDAIVDADAELVDGYDVWVPYYVVSPYLIPVHAKAGEASDIVGSLAPGAIVYGLQPRGEWILIADGSDIEYFVKTGYLLPFEKNMSEISVFHENYAEQSGGFTSASNIDNISGMSLEDITLALQDYPALLEIREPVMLYEKKYGVNAYFTLGVAAQESAYGTSPLAKIKNNLFGIGAYNENSFESALTFASKSESVEYFCMLIAGYRDNNRTTPASINERYASDNQWAEKVVLLMNQFSSQVHGAR
jgi:flagellum-specific peptidoglycan hydrolase FlgJ